MNTLAFAEHLASLDLPDSQIQTAIEAVAAFEEYLHNGGADLETCTAADVNDYSCELISAGQNSRKGYLALARYAEFIRNDDFFAAVYDFFEGPDVLSLLYAEVDREIGVFGRREIVSAEEPPTFGLPATGKAAATARLMEDLKAAKPPVDYTGMLYRIRHGLPADFLAGAREEYLEAGSIDAFIEKKASQFIATLENHRSSGTLFFSQPVTNKVVDYVLRNPEISCAVREGDVLYKTKIPAQTAKYLKESDPVRKRYFACHCPWARESITASEMDAPSTAVPAEFCHCSAGFVAQMWEKALDCRLEAEVLETALTGAARCRFLIRLPAQSR